MAVTEGRRLAGRVVLVTGASSGIGEAACIAFASEGATVIATARRFDRLTSVAERIAELGGTAMPLLLDVTDEDNTRAAIDLLRERYGRLDVLVNSAGVLQSARIADADPADWRDMIDANLFGLMLVTKLALPLLKETHCAHIFNISSISARLANAGSPCYAATKAAVGAFTETLRKDVASQGIRVTVVLPGLVETEALDKIRDAATKERFATMARTIEPLQAVDIANAIVFANLQPDHVSIGEMVIRPTQMPD